MSTIRFNDGISFDTSGPFRPTYRPDGWYVVGGGWLIPVQSREEAVKTAAQMQEEQNNSTQPRT